MRLGGGDGGKYKISNSTGNQKSLAVSVQRCHFSLIAVKLRWMMFHFWPELLEYNALKVQDHCFKNIFFLSSLVFMTSFRSSVSKWGLSCFNHFSLVSLTHSGPKQENLWTVNALYWNYFVHAVCPYFMTKEKMAYTAFSACNAILPSQCLLVWNSLLMFSLLILSGTRLRPLDIT